MMEDGIATTLPCGYGSDSSRSFPHYCSIPMTIMPERDAANHHYSTQHTATTHIYTVQCLHRWGHRPSLSVRGSLGGLSWGTYRGMGGITIVEVLTCYRRVGSRVLAQLFKAQRMAMGEGVISITVAYLQYTVQSNPHSCP